MLLYFYDEIAFCDCRHEPAGDDGQADTLIVEGSAITSMRHG
jgi:hypothetical protein